MSVTIILTSHMKPTLGEALASVMAQTRRDYECVVMDSGAWQGQTDERAMLMRDAIGRAAGLGGFRLAFTGEPPDLRLHKCPVSWATNEAIRRGYVTGDYVCTFYDDDLYEPTYIEKMAGYLDEHPEADAVWCSQDRIRWPAGTRERFIMADRPKHPGQMDCQVDGAQVMFRRSVLDKMGDPWMPEDPQTCGHSDGIFLERLVSIVGVIPNIPDVLVTHRFTPYSTYTPS